MGTYILGIDNFGTDILGVAILGIDIQAPIHIMHVIGGYLYIIVYDVVMLLYKL